MALSDAFLITKINCITSALSRRQIKLPELTGRGALLTLNVMLEETMATLGVRCSNTDCHFAVLDGSQESPDIISAKKFKFPKGFSKAEALNWFNLEVSDFLKSTKIETIAIRSPENNARRSSSLDTRLQFEGILYLLSAQLGIENVESKIKSTIAKDLGLKGKGKYLDTKLDTSCVDNFDDYSTKEQEAIMVAWSCLD